MNKKVISIEVVEKKIFFIRGQRVIMDSDLAQVYGVETRVLNQAVKRNRSRFPSDFMIRVSPAELEEWQRSRSQSVILNGQTMRSQSVIASKRNIRYQPHAFTEHGAIMAANVLNSTRAIQMGVFVVRAFIRLKEMMTGNEELRKKIKALERKTDKKFAVVFHEIERLMDGPVKPVHVKGFNAAAKAVISRTSLKIPIMPSVRLDAK